MLGKYNDGQISCTSSLSFLVTYVKSTRNLALLLILTRHSFRYQCEKWSLLLSETVQTYCAPTLARFSVGYGIMERLLTDFILDKGGFFSPRQVEDVQLYS
jgi:hypothetical protein